MSELDARVFLEKVAFTSHRRETAGPLFLNDILKTIASAGNMFCSLTFSP